MYPLALLCQLAEACGPRLIAGEAGILDVLDAAKRRSESRFSAEVDKQTDVARRMVQDLLQQNTLLMETGDEDILRQAFEDGSSVVCRRCQALVAASRWEQHRDMWCSAISDDDEMDKQTEDDDES